MKSWLKSAHSETADRVLKMIWTAMKLKIPPLSPYIFAVLFSAARLRTKVEPSHRAVFPAGQERVRVIWYRHNLTKQGKKWMWCWREKPCVSWEMVPHLWYLICCSVMAGELTLSVVLWTFLGVGVEDDAVSRAGDDLFTVCVGHELCAEDVCSMTWAYRLLDL